MAAINPVIEFTPCALSVSEKLHTLITQELIKEGTATSSHITLNFRDSSYSAENGGFHPVEIGLQRNGDGHFDILYITDFAFMGNYYPELERSLDFDFGNQVAFTVATGWQSIQSPGIDDLYQLWERNFISYVNMGAFDVVQINPK
ncbi:DUF2787 domain-containing protein [Vibrio fluvialis]|nr:DUF2787 domain-containing protein [Vibrio fluvialis]